MDGGGIVTHGVPGDEISLALARIPAGWFQMGCDTGQDNEKPVHRVWVDEFRLAVFQVTNAEYARFVRAAGTLAPRWRDAALWRRSRPARRPRRTRWSSRDGRRAGWW